MAVPTVPRSQSSFVRLTGVPARTETSSCVSVHALMAPGWWGRVLPPSDCCELLCGVNAFTAQVLILLDF